MWTYYVTLIAVAAYPSCASSELEKQPNANGGLYSSNKGSSALEKSTSANGQSSELEKQMSVLSKQVTALLEKRNEDLMSIEENLRKNVRENSEVAELKKELVNLRELVDQLTSATPSGAHHQQNDKLTVKWLSHTVQELKQEVSELQGALNSSVMLENHEREETTFSLMKSDISNLNAQLENAREKNARYEAEMVFLKEELQSLRDNWKRTAVMCGKTKNQLKSLQLEWSHNWKELDVKKLLPLDDPTLPNPPRHQRILRRHILNLEKTSKTLTKENYFLKSRLLKIEEEVHLLKNGKSNPANMLEKYDRISGNDIENFIESNEIKEVNIDVNRENIQSLTKQQLLNTKSITNLTEQLIDFNKLHLSMLELLENVESIEAKIDKSLPEFRKEISKLEIQLNEATADESQIKEEQKNVRDSLKAIGFSVSSMQDKASEHKERLEKVEEVLKVLEKSSTAQTTKLHNHILKEESSTINLNVTRSTIHLVEELKSFESEYKSIVNKLPRDCSTVEGPNGIYLISPGDGEPILAHCDDGWTTVQKRYDGSINFNRNWNEYSNGFGSATGEHWLGNINLHYLTKDNCTRLQISMKDIYGKYWQANYDDIRVGDYATGFKLLITRYHGNASDAMDYQNNMEFSTIDNDRDISNTHCASNYEGGWWFSHCQHANLNGRYNLGLTWFDNSRNEWIAVSQSEMRLKRRDVC